MTRAVTCSPTARADHSGTGLRTRDFYPSAARAYRRENPITAGTFASETSRPVDLSPEAEFAKCTVTAWGHPHAETRTHFAAPTCSCAGSEDHNVCPPLNYPFQKINANCA